jgi:hypothetical protein
MSVKNLLTNTYNPQEKLAADTRGLVNKWDRTGLLENISSDIEKSNMSVLLENQAKQLIDEATRTGTSANSEQWAGVALPLVRRVFAEISAKEFVSVQPMNLPSGLIFYLDFKYGTDQAGNPSFEGKSLFGGTETKLGSTDKAEGGLYGAGRFGYSINDLVTASVVPTATAAASYGDACFDVNLSQSVAAGELWTVAVTLDGTQDDEGVRAFTFTSASADPINIPSLTKSGAALNQVIFVVSASVAPSEGDVAYHRQPTDQTRGDFEDGDSNPNAGDVPPVGSSHDAETGLRKDIGIPEVNLELKSEAIVAKTRKLKAVWTPELAQDLNAYHSIDAEAELTALLSEYVSMEIDLEILDMLLLQSSEETTERWSAAIGREYNKAAGLFEDTAVNRTAYIKQTWFQTLGNKIQKVSNKIHQLTLRGGANFLVCSPDVATIIESIPGYTTNTDGDMAKFAMGVSKVGSLAQRWQVYKNPYMTNNKILIGFRGTNFLETGAVYAPYIPLIQTPLVYDPVNFTPRRGVMTRYAKKVVRPEFYGQVIVGDLDQV